MILHNDQICFKRPVETRERGHDLFKPTHSFHCFRDSKVCRGNFKSVKTLFKVQSACVVGC